MVASWQQRRGEDECGDHTAAHSSGAEKVRLRLELRINTESLTADGVRRIRLRRSDTINSPSNQVQVSVHNFIRVSAESAQPSCKIAFAAVSNCRNSLHSHCPSLSLLCCSPLPPLQPYIMQSVLSPACPLPPSHSVFLSADHVRLIAAYLAINDLLTASTLCRSLHTLFDSDAVWQSRLKAAEAQQRVDVDVAGPADAILSLAQLAALPALPSLSEVASLLLQSYIAHYERLWHARDPQPEFISGRTLSLSPCPRLAAIARLPSSLRYHARILAPTATSSYYHPLVHTAVYLECGLHYSEEQRRWMVEILDKHWGGKVNSARNVDDAIGQEEASQDPTSNHHTAPSSKQRYIDLLKCSEHEHRGCYRLLPPSHPVSHTRPSYLPDHCPLPLCCLCRAVIARTITRAHIQPRAVLSLDYRVVSVTRINRTMYETSLRAVAGSRTATEVSTPLDHRVVITHRRGMGGDSAAVEGYEVVAYCNVEAVYVAEQNVCEVCRCGISGSGGGHHESCRKRSTGSWSQRASGHAV